MPRKEGLFLFFVDCGAIGLAKDCGQGDSAAGKRADDWFTADKLCGRRWLSTLGGDVTTEEFEVEVFAVKAVPTVLVDFRDGGDRYSEGKVYVFERRGSPAGNLDIGKGCVCGASTLIIL